MMGKKIQTKKNQTSRLVPDVVDRMGFLLVALFAKRNISLMEQVILEIEIFSISPSCNHETRPLLLPKANKQRHNATHSDRATERKFMRTTLTTDQGGGLREASTCNSICLRSS